MEPEIAACTIIAFSKDCSVTISEGVSPIRARRTACLPAAAAASCRPLSAAGMSAVPGRARPSASAMICMVEAVPMKEQEPQEGQAWV